MAVGNGCRGAWLTCALRMTCVAWRGYGGAAARAQGGGGGHAVVVMGGSGTGRGAAAAAATESAAQTHRPTHRNWRPRRGGAWVAAAATGAVQVHVLRG